MSKLHDDVYVAGGGCTCAAYSESECCCDVDWTDPKIYELEEKFDKYIELLATLKNTLNEDSPTSNRLFVVQGIVDQFTEELI